MKKIFALMLTVSMIFSVVSCSRVPEETLIDPVETTLYPIDTTLWEHDCTTTGYHHDCTTATSNLDVFTSSRDDIAPLAPVVTLYDATGEALAPYSELVWFTDGTVVGDGALMFMSVTSRLSDIADEIPRVHFSGTPRVEATAREGVSIRGGETVNIYGEDYKLLAERIPISELWEKGNAEWKGQLVYIYFTVLFSDETPDYNKSTENGYFVKTVF
jgi:hypothetical protein